MARKRKVFDVEDEAGDATISFISPRDIFKTGGYEHLVVARDQTTFTCVRNGDASLRGENVLDIIETKYALPIRGSPGIAQMSERTLHPGEPSQCNKVYNDYLSQLNALIEEQKTMRAGM